jgi:hypothetical protein
MNLQMTNWTNASEWFTEERREVLRYEINLLLRR